MSEEEKKWREQNEKLKKKQKQREILKLLIF